MREHYEDEEPIDDDDDADYVEVLVVDDDNNGLLVSASDDELDASGSSSSAHSSSNSSSKSSRPYHYKGNDDEPELDDKTIAQKLSPIDDEEDVVLQSLAQERKKNQNLEHEYLVAQVEQFKINYAAKQKEVEFYEEAIGEAVNIADGAQAQAAIKLRDEAVAQLRQMDANWAYANDQYVKSKNSSDGKVKQYAGKFMQKHGWDNLSESMRKKWLKIDQKVCDMGYDPATPEYYRKLENSLKGLGLMNQLKKHNTIAAPRKVNSSSSSKPREIKLSRERVEAIEASGRLRGTPEFRKMAIAYDKYDKEGGAAREPVWSVGG